MIINEFPPTGESGVQRPLKFLKYAAREGFQTYVITPGKPPKHILDESLLQEIPKDTLIFKTPSLGLKGKGVDHVANLRTTIEYKANPVKRIFWSSLKLLNDILLPLDKQIGWVPFAFVKTLVVIRKYNIRNVYITAFPFSAFLVGILLKSLKKDKIRWIADYRDAWQFWPRLQTNVHKLRYRIIQHWDEVTLRNADIVVFNTDFIKERYIAAYPWVEKKTTVIQNGYDEDDFNSLIPHKFEKFTFLFMGKTYVGLRNPINLLKAINRSGLENFQFVQIGSSPKELLNEITNLHLDFFKFEGYVPHHEALCYALGADINVIIFTDDDSSLIGLPGGKFYEVIRAGKPVLVIGPDLPLIRNIMKDFTSVRYANLENEEEIICCIKELRNMHFSVDSLKESISQFSRENLTHKLLSTL